MIVHDVEQGSPEWFALRSIPTASNFDKIVTSKGKPSASAKGYMNELLATWLAGGAPDEGYTNAWMDRGHELEGIAREWYEFKRDTVTQVGFVTTDNGLYGCSPDGLVGVSGGLEIKAPKGSTLVSYLLLADGKIPTTYWGQCQGCLYVTKRDYWDFLGWHPELPPFLTRVYPDENYHAQLEIQLEKFTLNMDIQKQILIQKGYKNEIQI